ncbi:MAG: DJ-1/PfpI family protein [Erythrobacter sp.]|uniref:DJ-1/PfpI family protein n=1 Tax=Erythrobacter sp. TaxID=1042 RepID=UPI0026158BAE|nr:DJ-1/PfpI family protein [Erythrobacter sp.]MDJ0978900.1 DJ-1/PfpI family protein [Erythrobacter sp.]
MTFRVVIPIFDDVTQLDFTGPAHVFAKVPGVELCIASKGTAPVQTDSAFAIHAPYTFSQCPSADLICVPGGVGIMSAIQDPDFLDFIDRQCRGAQYVTSVCTGLFALGALGLVEGRKVTTHWGYEKVIGDCGGVYTKGRVVVDGNLITAGGVTSGIDFGLAVIAQVFGEEIARLIQLSSEYNPKPPFESGHPSVADEETVAQANPFYAELAQRMREALKAARRS